MCESLLQANTSLFGFIVPYFFVKNFLMNYKYGAAAWLAIASFFADIIIRFFYCVKPFSDILLYGSGMALTSILIGYLFYKMDLIRNA